MRVPAISVIMPVYNAQRYLGETIASLQAQTFADFEVICVDDGSTDDSMAILDQVIAQDPRFRVVNQENAGAGAARNKGFTHARGEYAIFLDSDDLFSPKLLEKLYQAITENDADIAACNFSRFDVNGKETQHEGVHTRWIPEGLKVFSYRDTPDYIMRVINPTPWNKLYRSAFIREHNLKYEEISSTNDITFAAVSVAAAERVTYIKDSLVRYRIGHAGSISARKTKNLNNVKIAVLSAVRQARQLPHSEVIKNSILSFVVDNFVFSLGRYVKDFSDPAAEAFYRMVHETFNREEFANVDPRTLHNPHQFLEFCTVRKHDYETMKRMIARRLIVSMTTYPARIHLIPQVLESIEKQTRKADEVILWLAREQFPGAEADLPESVRCLIEEKRLTLRWCDDLKPHKKYFYALQEYNEDLVVTVDDDLLYSPNMLSTLYASYLLYPDAASTVRAHLIMLDEEQRILPYGSWIQETDACLNKPSMQLLATGGAGVLHPPGLYRKEMFDTEAIREHCLWADDLWLKAMQVVSDVPVVLARPFEPLQYLPDSQENALHLLNVQQRQNDFQLEKTIQWLDETFEPGIFMRKLTEDCAGERILGMKVVSEHLDRERKQNRRMALQADTKLKQTQNDVRRLQQNIKKLEEKQNGLQKEIAKYQAQLREREEKLQRAQQQLKQEQTGRRDAVGKLRTVEENASIGRQLKNVGEDLRKQRKAGGNPLYAAFKYGVYLLAWVPEKMLAFMLYFLKNGGKQTIKKLLGR